MPFEKGNKLGHGRPFAGAALSEALRRLLEEPIDLTETENKKFPANTPRKEIIAWILVDKALDGDMQAIKEVFDRTEGRPEQKQILVGEEGAPGILIEFSSNGQGKIQPDAKAEPGNGDNAGASA